MTIQIGVGDKFTYNKEHWIIIDVRGDKFICRNKNNKSICEFDKDTIKKLIK